MLYLATCYGQGRLFKQSFKKAFHYYKLYSNKGNARCLFEVAQCYREGRGTKKSLGKAIEYYQLASKSGYPKDAIEHVVSLCRKKLNEKVASE